MLRSAQRCRVLSLYPRSSDTALLGSCQPRTDLALSLRREDVVGGSWTIHPEGQRGDVEREILVRQLLSGLGRFVPYSDRAGRRRKLDFSRRLSEANFPRVPTASLFQPFLCESCVISKQS